PAGTGADGAAARTQDAGRADRHPWPRTDGHVPALRDGHAPRRTDRHPVAVTGQRFLLGAVTVVTALLLQVTVVGRLPLPGAAPDLVLVVVIAFALAEGPMSGMVTGFFAGLLTDALSAHEMGRLALAYALAGYVTGMLQDDTERSTLQPFGAVALGALAALASFSVEGILLGDPRVTLQPVVRSALSSVPYDVVLTPFVVPLVAGLVRRLDVDPLRRL
ncbi:MAG: rod shape-determining protein MreD, partial [Mycobacteriales bacterium]